MSETKAGQSRRDFIGTLGVIGAAGAVGAVAAGCSGRALYPDYVYPPLLDRAPDGPLLKAGLIGCGGRGTGAAQQFLEAGPNLEVVALADYFQDRVDNCRATLLEEKGVEIPDEQCFTGFDAYLRLLETDVDVVLMATPPFFRPEHFEASVEARKHVFMEKPVAVDPVGCR